jgi:hypothetical protein
MEDRTVAKTTARIVLSFDAETQTYKPAGHNLSAEQAIEQVNKIQADGGVAVIVEQERHHRPLSFHQCKPCKEAAETHGKQQTQSAAEEQPPEVAEVSRDAAEE